MKRILSTFTLLFMALCSLSAQKIVRFEDELSGLYGYKQQGKIIIEAQFVQAAKEFSEGLAAVEIVKPNMLSTHNWGYINREGEFVIKPQFYYAQNFSENVAVVNTLDGWRFINKHGEFTIIDTPAERLDDFHNGLAPYMIARNSWARTPELWGFINKEGSIIVEPIYTKVFSFEKGFALVKTFNRYGNYVYVNMWGEEISKVVWHISEANKLLKLYKKTEKGKAYMLWYKETYGK